MGKQKSAPEKGTQDGALSSTNQTAVAGTAEEKLVWDALEEARQSVKPAVKKEMEGEMINQDLLNFRLRGRCGDPRRSWT